MKKWAWEEILKAITEKLEPHPEKYFRMVMEDEEGFDWVEVGAIKHALKKALEELEGFDEAREFGQEWIDWNELVERGE